jgi:predicted GNAT family N-acyltransferase
MLIIKNINYLECLDIRHKVLWPSKPKEFCIVAGDKEANHYGAFIEGKLLGVASTYQNDSSVRLRKFAVDKVFQGKGVGSQLLSNIIETERANTRQIFWCDARASAVNFYNKFGLTKQGEVFDKSGVLYYKMSLSLQQ